MAFIPTRAAALQRLDDFVREGAARYAQRRNEDPGRDAIGGVSALSPWIRRRALLESEVCTRVLQAHAWPQVEKYVQEICWRTYWKGWLQQRPAVWTRYLVACAEAQAQVEHDGALRRRYRAALDARTGIACFDAWRDELADTGHLHNHARMWFASIWIFSLRLPWPLGAALFLRELLDGDLASNTLSWRWVAGLHTRGKHYLARAENIARFSANRYDPRGQLDENAAPLPPDEEAPRIALDCPATPDWTRPSVLLLHEDDLHAASLLPARDTALRGIAVLASAARCGSHPDLRVSRVQDFVEALLTDATQVARQAHGVAVELLGPFELLRWARGLGATQLIVPVAPLGPEAERLDALREQALAQGLVWSPLLRDWDRAFWPHATHGFFQLRERIPAVLRGLGILP
jgi:deoxyribodipyrimidine photo-lyase